MQISNKFFQGMIQDLKNDGFKFKSDVVNITSITIMMSPSEILAETQKPEIIKTITPIYEDISLQKTITTMIIPEDN